MPHDAYKALYLHIPFCVKKCDYCDFTSFCLPRDHREIDEYVEQLVIQIRRKAKEGELAALDTVYIGGGTPSHIGQKRLSSLLYALSLSMRLEPDVECTMEANPESITPELIRDVFALGVNRLSIGVQSFDDDVLATLGRAHDAAKAEEAIRTALERFENVSLDLMCGIPGQTLESFENSVRKAIELGVTHVSIYPLTIEKGTPFAKAVRRGKLPYPDEDVQAACMERGGEMLEEAGYERYEVASYAKPGFECRHNIAYWTGLPYLGLGTSAATMTQNAERRMREKEGYITDDLDAAQMRAEDLMLGMRMSRGVSVGMVREYADLLPDAPATFLQLCKLGLVSLVAENGGIIAQAKNETLGAMDVEMVDAQGNSVDLAACADEASDEDRFAPTQLGWLCGNELYGRIFELAP